MAEQTERAERAERSGDDLDASGKEALAALRKLEDKPELKAGIEAVRDWWRGAYLKAGHKRLAKALLGRLEED